MSDIPEALKQILRPFGWYDGYTYDTFQYEKLYKDMGCPIHESARNFLEKFGGLRGILVKTRRFNFDPYPRNTPNQGIIRNKCGNKTQCQTSRLCRSHTPRTYKSTSLRRWSIFWSL
jgi:hypothetical protein